MSCGEPHETDCSEVLAEVWLLLDNEVDAVFAAVPEAFLSGKQELQLLEDRHPALTIQLEKAPPAAIRGNVVDANGRALKGARGSVVGYEDEAVLTPP